MAQQERLEKLLRDFHQKLMKEFGLIEKPNKQSGEERLEKQFNDFAFKIRKEFGLIEKTRKEFVPPTAGEVVKYFSTHGYREDIALRAFNYYDTANWVDSNGKKILNWRQKMVGVWFVDSNKAPVTKILDPTNVW